MDFQYCGNLLDFFISLKRFLQIGGISMKKYKVTYLLDGQEFTETMSERQLSNLERRLENGADEQIVYVEEIK